MDFKGYNLFTGSALSDQKDRNVSRGDVCDRALQCAHGWATAMNEILVGECPRFRQACR